MDLHSEMILEEYREALPVFERMQVQVMQTLREALERNGLIVTAVDSRIKTEESLAGKLALKGTKYASLSDITDILGARIITFYTDDVDRIAAMAEQLFEIDWNNSVDKRKLHQLDSFGYNSLHYICRLPGCDYRFELQLRTTLQHAWAAINHDTGYKSGVEIPREYLRRINRLAGLLELADDEFSRIRTEINDYRRRVQQLVQNGKLDDVLLDGDTFRSYLQAKPFDTLNKRIAAINQAEIQDVPLISYLRILKELGCRTLGDVSRMCDKYEDDADRLARHQLGNTDLDIISSAIGLQNICIVCILSQGGGKIGLLRFFDALNGHNSSNEDLAELTFKQASSLPFMKQ
jgi:ppGpp synthetase/RelA/SpoT-type nucleotidyltranferase